MTIRALIRFLLGNRQAIIDVASHPHAVWVGLLFVISAGFAREYDGEDLLAEPWHLLLPLAASLVTSFLLFNLVVFAAVTKGCTTISYGRLYRSFLGLYWMTAPLAWLYAIPMERFLSAPGSVQANLTLLAIVSLWRVVLMSRIVSVLFQTSAAVAGFLVVLFADSVALFVLHLTPLPVVSLMGGIRLSESEQILQGVAFLVGFGGILLWPVAAVLTVTFLSLQREPWKLAIDSDASSVPRAITPALWSLAAGAILIWGPILLWTQPEQQVRRQVEQDLRTGRFAEGIAVMGAHSPADFPPWWEPPPRIGFGERTPDVFALLGEALNQQAPDWVVDAYVAKLDRGDYEHHVTSGPWAKFVDRTNDELKAFLAIVDRLPQLRPIVARQQSALQAIAADISRPKELRERFRALLDEVEKARMEHRKDFN